MTKLKIGTKTGIDKKKEPKEDYLSKLSDEELGALQEEVENGVESDTIDEVAPITEEIIEANIEEDAKEAINGISILNEVGINMDYVNKFNEKHPNRKTIYRGVITKGFLEWYIKNVKLSLLNNLEIIDSEYVNQNHTPYLMQLIQTRLHEDVKLEIEENKTGVMLETGEQIQIYEFLLNEKWDNRADGILKLDALIEEQIRVQKCDLNKALKNLLGYFKLKRKFLKPLTPEKSKIKEMTSAEEKANIKHSITYFTYLKFLYNLMSKKMDFIEELTPKEIDKIEKITNLIESRTPIRTKTPKKKSKKKEPTLTMDNYFEEGDD